MQETAGNCREVSGLKNQERPHTFTRLESRVPSQTWPKSADSQSAKVKMRIPAIFLQTKSYPLQGDIQKRPACSTGEIQGGKFSGCVVCTNFLQTLRSPGHPGKIPGTSQVPPWLGNPRKTNFQGRDRAFRKPPSQPPRQSLDPSR